jgi:hypothetical protein
VKRTRRHCAHCPGAVPVRRVTGRSMTAERFGLGAQVAGLSGWRCSGCGAVALDRESAMLYALACDELARLLPRKRPRKKK